MQSKCSCCARATKALSARVLHLSAFQAQGLFLSECVKTIDSRVEKAVVVAVVQPAAVVVVAVALFAYRFASVQHISWLDAVVVLKAPS